MRIGIFSGSFDPIHTGHAMIANFAAQWLGLDEVWIMVSPLNPLKRESAGSGHRPYGNGFNSSFRLQQSQSIRFRVFPSCSFLYISYAYKS